MKNLICFLPLALAFSMLLAFGITTFAAEDTGFTDVPADAGYVEAVRWAADHGYINGYGIAVRCFQTAAVTRSFVRSPGAFCAET